VLAFVLSEIYFCGPATAGKGGFHDQIEELVFRLALFFCIAASASGQDQAPAPVFKEGDTWQFNRTNKGQLVSSSERISGIYELVFSQGQIKIYEVVGNQKNELDVKPGGPGEGLLAAVANSEQRPTLKFPLSVGQKWTYEYDSLGAGARPGAQAQKRSVEVIVSGMEQVTTPGGSFTAYKLVRTEQWRAGGRNVVWNKATTTYFYSPETRSVVKSSSLQENSGATSENELIKFTPGN
jgi:hypothetical protein